MRAILWKNALLKACAPLSTVVEIMMPVLFMLLLTWIKTLANDYDSPAVDYSCGQTYPWNYAESTSDILPGGALGQCLVPPDTCSPPGGVDTYYKSPIDFGVGEQYQNLGYVPSAVGQQYPWYAYTVGDTSPVFSTEYSHPPSPPFVKMGQTTNAKIAILPVTASDDLTTEATRFKDYLGNMLANSGVSPNKLVSFNSEADLETYVTDIDYDNVDKLGDKIAFAVVFNSINPSTAQFDYTIRVNFTAPLDMGQDMVPNINNSTDIPSSFSASSTSVNFILPSTKTFTDVLSRPATSSYFYGYAYSGFLALQEVTDEYLMSYAKVTADGSNVDDFVASGAPTVDTKVSMSLFPEFSLSANNFQAIIGTVLALFYMLAFLYPFSRFIRGLVLEKEEKIKEGMKIMGLSDVVYALSWLITLTVQSSITTFGILLVTRGSVFEYSDDAVIFLYFFAFSVSVVMMTFLLATFFSKAKSAAILGTIIFFGSYFPYYAVSDPTMSTIVKLLGSLLAPTAFALGAGVIGNLEGAGIGATPSTSFDMYDNFSLFYCIFMLVVDSVLYGFLAAYFDKVLPSEYGTQLPWHFPYTYVKEMFVGKGREGEGPGADLHQPLLDQLEGTVTNADVKQEAVNADLMSQITEKRTVSIRNLRKVFKTTGEDRVAVDNLSMDMYEGQISVLLGHNGAGKSTTISMLTGLINSTAGEAFIKGKMMTKDMKDIRSSMGVCPQHDVLFADLTVAQHLRMFATFKGVPSREIEDAVQTTIAEVGLTEKANVASKQLSGGMKRKLSVGIALIGDSKVVILDEPTSGMDPYSRRSTWNILQRNKAGRIILLTTHFMDEADILGDRIGIMAHGQLQCIGSSMFLKSAYGVGYTFTIVRTNGSTESQSKELDRVVRKFVASAEPLSMVGSEQSYRLPFSASDSFVGLFDVMEMDKLKLGVSSYGISVTTLEEVFIRVGKGIADEKDREHLSSIARGSSMVAAGGGVDAAAGEKEGGEVKSPLLKSEEPAEANGSAFVSSITGRVSERKVFMTHTKALLRKRAIYGMRDKKSFCFQLVIPTILVLFGMILLTVRGGIDQPSIELLSSGGEFNKDFDAKYRNPLPVYVENGNTYGESILANLNLIPNTDTSAKDVTAEATAADDAFFGCAAGATPLKAMSNYLINTPDADLSSELGASRYGAITIADTGTSGSSFAYNIMVNASSTQGPGIFMNLVNSASLMTLVGSTDAYIKTNNHPLPATNKENSFDQTADAFTAALMVMIAFCFLPASYVIFVVKEREVKAKHQQIISGVSLSAYWFATFAWDAVSYLAPFTLTMGLIYAFGIDNYTQGEGGIACALLFLLFGPAVAGFTYISSFLFKSHSTAQNIILFQNFVTGLCLMITSFVLSLIDSTKEINMTLKWFYRLFPGFCLGDGLIQLTFCNKGKCPTYVDGGLSFAETQGPLKWDVAGGDITYLAIEIVVYFFLTWSIEYALSFPSLLSCFSSLTVSDPGDGADDEADDEDVANEKERVGRGDADGDVVVLKDLRKVYGNGKVAVKGLNFGIPNGECFGFLGINGAGKTTTLSILSGEFPPSSGTGFIGGYDIKGDQSLIRRKIGYCPQFDALLELLTVEEHLMLYGRIKGMGERSLPGIVQGIMSDMDLLDFANKAAGSLSGGNKRKLSVAIAMIGGPSIVFLDEPSTGMDPVARRFMWDVIANMSTKEGKCSVILTTHSMEEAEALCSRIGIMVAGRLRCLGSGQHLKIRHGSGYEVDVKIDAVPASAVLDAFTLLARNSALPVGSFAEIPTHIAASFTSGKGKGGKIYKDEADARNILINLGLVRVNLENLRRLCTSMGKPGRMGQITPNGSGSALYEMQVVTGDVQVESFLEWWILEDLFENLESFFSENFKEAKLAERSTLSSCRYQVSDKGLSLPQIFGVLEKNKKGLGIQEYSVGQTTLEQIFNQFAGTSNNPENAE